MSTVQIQRIHPDATYPTKGTPTSAAWDVCCVEGAWMAPHSNVVFSTGLVFGLPDDLWLDVRGRSGLAFKHHVVAFNGVGDPDYRGELKVLLHNLGDVGFEVRAGDRIAQVIFRRVEPVSLVQVLGGLHDAEAHGGFGSTGR